MTATETIQWESRSVGGSRFADGSAIVRPAEVAWTDGPLEGLTFRLTHVDRPTSMWTAIFKAGANMSIPAHFNYGEVQIYILEGSLAIGDLLLEVGNYYQSPGGVLDGCVAGPAGATYFVMYTAGGLSAADEDGEPTGPYFDVNRMYKLASKNDAAAHLPAVD
jgi:hypothetical protein